MEKKCEKPRESWEERESEERHVPVPGIPSDWFIFDSLLQHLRHSLGLARAE